VIPPLEELARERVAALLGARSRVVGVAALASGDDGAVALVTLARPPRRLVLKVAAAHAAPAVDLERTAAASELARACGAPVAAVLAVGTVPGEGGWSYLLQEHVEGVDWRGVRPLLDPDQLVAAHRQIATAVLAVQSARLDRFGELDPGNGPAARDLGHALRRRAELRIADAGRRAVFCALLEREADLLAGDRSAPTLCHDDLHHANVVFRAERGTWRLAGLLDWDKAWAGPAESDIARMAFWDDMTGPGFWATYRAAVPVSEGEHERALVHQLLWCLEYPADTPRHRADTAALCRRLGVRLPDAGRGPAAAS
jgi:aminoglycoside phosphotransferase (APT) family kinase protein